MYYLEKELWKEEMKVCLLEDEVFTLIDYLRLDNSEEIKSNVILFRSLLNFKKNTNLLPTYKKHIHKTICIVYKDIINKISDIACDSFFHKSGLPDEEIDLSYLTLKKEIDYKQGFLF